MLSTINDFFANPEFLLLLMLLPVLAFLRGKTGHRAAIRFPATALAKQIAALVRTRTGKFLGTMRLLTLAILIIALARPQLKKGTTEIEASGIDIMLVMDVSSSMWSMDFEIKGRLTDRLTASRQVVEKFIESRPNDRIGLIAFAGQPYLVSPPTLNHDWLSQNLERLKIGLIEDGTAIGTAIGVGTNHLSSQSAKSRILILLTDGSNNAGKITPVAAAEAADRLYNIKIYAIGAGKPGRVPYPRLGRNGQPLYDRSGRPVVTYSQSDLDEETLKTVAEKTRGKYYRATSTKALESIYNEIDTLEKTEKKLKYSAIYTDLYHWFLIAGLLSLFLELILSNTKFRRLP